MSDDAQADLRQHVLALLDAKGAHLSFDAVVEDWPPELRGAKPEGAAHSAWQLVEHLRLAQKDIYDFTASEHYEEQPWPDAFWPAGEAPPDAESWKASLAGFRKDLEAMKAVVANPSTDLFAKVPRGTGQTVLREALLVADHNAYHVGQLAMLRRLLGAWHAPVLGI